MYFASHKNNMNIMKTADFNKVTSQVKCKYFYKRNIFLWLWQSLSFQLPKSLCVKFKILR